MSKHYEYLEAVNPKDGSKFTVKVSHKRMKAVATRGEGAIYEMAYVLPEILKAPRMIFEGLLRNEDEPSDDYSIGWLCYVGIPSKAYMSDGKQVKPWEDEVYLVFVNNENVVYNWRWEKADNQDITMPTEYNKRFKRRSL